MRALDLEGLPDEVVDEVDGGTLEEGQRDLVDEHGGPVPLDDDVVRLRRPLDVEGVLEAGAAAAVDADAQHRPGRLGAHDLVDAPRRPFREADLAHRAVQLACHYLRSEGNGRCSRLQPGGPMRPFGERWTAPYACNPAESRGRLYPEAGSPTRSEFQRDRDRIIHSSAFRRLKHKTQVFVYHEGDHYRTRLTHTLEVSQIARALARSLGLNEDLAEALALSHDLGHTPFGHTGEDVLDACMAAYGGFDHNAQALRVVARLERRYAAYDGLNLAWETLEGLVKHNGPLLDAGGQPTGRYRRRGVPRAVLEYNEVQDLQLTTHAGGEAQAAALADDIAYNAHDLDDGLRAGLFALDDLRDTPFLRELLDEVDSRWPGLELSRRIHELVRRVITRFVEDATREGERRIAELGPREGDDIRAAAAPVI